MELLFTNKHTVIEAEYRFQLDTGEVIYYKEWLDEKGEIIDCILRSKHGYEIDDPIIMEQVQNKIWHLERKNN